MGHHVVTCRDAVQTSPSPPCTPGTLGLLRALRSKRLNQVKDTSASGNLRRRFDPEELDLPQL